MSFASRSRFGVLLLSLMLGASVTAFADSQRYSAPEFTKATRVHGTIVDVAVSNPDFSTLIAALQAADLVTTLQGPGPFTVFAPTNDAFAKIPPAILDFLLSEPPALASVLTYHVVAGRKDLRYAFIPWKLDTVQGQVVYANRGRFSLAINNAQVQGRIIVADNGLIHVIDSVLLPQFE